MVSYSQCISLSIVNLKCSFYSAEEKRGLDMKNHHHLQSTQWPPFQALSHQYGMTRPTAVKHVELAST